MSTATSEGIAVWLTGLPASGKTTIAQALQRELAAMGVATQLLDSDEMRHILTPDPDYSAAARDRFYAVLVYIAGLLTRNGVHVLIAATGPRRRHREAARQQMAYFCEVYVATDLSTCQSRDPKGLYARAAAGEIETLPGIGLPYEPPPAAEITISGDDAVDEAVAKIKQLLFAKWLAQKPHRVPPRSTFA